jgi:hypothetical protein
MDQRISDINIEINNRVQGGRKRKEERWRRQPSVVVEVQLAMSTAMTQSNIEVASESVYWMQGRRGRCRGDGVSLHFSAP